MAKINLEASSTVYLIAHGSFLEVKASHKETKYANNQNKEKNEDRNKSNKDIFAPANCCARCHVTVAW